MSSREIVFIDVGSSEASTALAPVSTPPSPERSLARYLRIAGAAGRTAVHNTAVASRFIWQHRVAITAGLAAFGVGMGIGAATRLTGETNFYNTLCHSMSDYLGLARGTQPTASHEATGTMARGGIGGALFALSTGLHMMFRHGNRVAARTALDPNLPHTPFSGEKPAGYYYLSAQHFNARRQRAEWKTRLWESRLEFMQKQQLAQEIVESLGGAPAPVTTLYLAANYTAPAHDTYSAIAPIPGVSPADENIITGFEALLASSASVAPAGAR